MIITKTPFRMSFFGGGTDMPAFFNEHGGAVISTTFDKYCYVNVRHMPPFHPYISELVHNRFIYKMMLKVIKPKAKEESVCQAFYSTPYPINRQIFPIEWHGHGKRIPFENRFYVCPNESEKLLQLIYGDDYTELPPVEKRKTHCPIRVVFSDGEEIIFEHPKTAIKYEDIIS